MKRKALGKGLSALLPEPEKPASVGQEIPIDQLEPNPYQPRTVMGEEALRDLIASVREHGIVQPIVVRRVADRYQIVAGERRWRAAQNVGLARVPVVIREVPDDRLLELALIENIQREELTPLEEADALFRLRDELGLTQEQVAQRVGRDRSTIANILRLLRAPKAVRDLLAARRLDPGHVRALLALASADDQEALGREAARKGLTVREVERRVSASHASPKRSATTRDANTRAAEERLRAALGTHVDVIRRGKGGTLRIAFTGEKELNRLYELLVRSSGSRAR
jgi:ParB family chromosome partitioning protein